jgi:hypothetical protein
MEERMKILEMLADKTITVSEANELLSTLDKQKIEVPAGDGVKVLKAEDALRTGAGKMLYVKVLSSDGDKVNISIPIAFVKAAIKAGTLGNLMNKSVKVNGSSVMENVDLDLLIASIESGQIGNIVQVESADGDSVNIYIE